MLKVIICDEDGVVVGGLLGEREDSREDTQGGISVKRMIYRRDDTNTGAIILKDRSSCYKLYLSDILYIETAGKCTKIHMINGVLNTEKKMKEYEKVLRKRDFVRCHNSYIVNLRYVYVIRKFEIILESGDKVYISKARKRIVREKFFKYVGNII